MEARWLGRWEGEESEVEGEDEREVMGERGERKSGSGRENNGGKRKGKESASGGRHLGCGRL